MYYELLEVEGEKPLQGYLAQSQYEENRPDKKRRSGAIPTM
jgi:hypothetical protein